jgi:AraC-like DNA-binding protein
MRQVELKCTKQKGRGYLSDDEERELIRLTTNELRRSPDQSLELATLCCESLAVRHNRILNSLRRKLLELISAVTSTVGIHSAVSHEYVDIVQQIMTTYAMSDFVEWFPSRLVHLAKLTDEARHESIDSYSKLVNDARSYLEQQFTAPISLYDTARAVHVSMEHLSRVFKAETGRTVGERLNELRIEHAKDQLSQLDLPVKAIANACGFTTQEHFHRMFRRSVGITPGQFRRQHID